MPVLYRGTKSIPWKEFFSTYREPMVTCQIIPDRTAKNWNVDVLSRAASELYVNLPRRFKFDRFRITYEVQEVVGFDIIMESDKIAFYVTVPECRWSMFLQKLEVIWPKATYKPAEIPKIDTDKAKCAEMVLDKHDLFSLKTAKNDNDPLNNMLQAVRDLKDNDIARINILAKPVSRTIWEQKARAAFKKHWEGKELNRTELSTSGLLMGLVRAIDAVFSGTHGTLSEWTGGDKTIKDDGNISRLLNRKKNVREATVEKISQPVFHTDIRIAVQSDDPLRADTAIRSISNSFKDLNADNELCRKDVNPNAIKEFVSNIEDFRYPAVNIGHNTLSAKELGKLMQIPGAELQDSFPEINQVQRREVSVPDVLLNGGIKIGTTKCKGAESTVYWPVKNYDELCLSRVLIGKQGSGKSTMASNFAIGSIEQGFSVFVHDVADGKLCDDVRDAIPADFPHDHIIELDFGDSLNPIGLDWYDSANRATGKVASRLSSELAMFLERFTDETGGRTRRWLKKAAQAVYSLPDSSLLDVLLMLTSKEFRKKMYPRLTDRLVLQAWKNFDKMSDAAQNQIIQPVLNRIDYLLDDESLKSILCQTPNLGLDFRKWADGDTHPYCILIRVPKAILGPAATDALMTFLNTKLWMAILTRMDVSIDNRKPCFSIYDEPHQFPGVTARAREQFAEGRKWRLGQVWCFHHWEQIDRQLSHIIQATGPHFVLYTTSKHTWQSLAEEIQPFTIEEALDLPRFSAIMCVTANTNRITPFIVKSCEPLPTHSNRFELRQACSELYGKSMDKVNEYIEQKEQLFFN